MSTAYKSSYSAMGTLHPCHITSLANRSLARGKMQTVDLWTGKRLGFMLRVRVRVSVRVKIKVRVNAAFYPIASPQVWSAVRIFP